MKQKQETALSYVYIRMSLLHANFGVPAVEILLEMRLPISCPWRLENPVLHVRVAMEHLPLSKRLTPMAGVLCSLARMEGEMAERLLTGEEKERRPPELSVKIWPDDLGSLLLS
jgi:hypothetical protein